jgi:PAS domain S-box-containing protein
MIMIDEQFRQSIATIQQHIRVLQEEQAAEAREEISAALENLQLIYEEMQAGLEATEVVEQKMIEQNQQITASYQHYYDLFHSSPIAYLVTDVNGAILEANSAAFQLLNVPQSYLIGKYLATFIAPGTDRITFRLKLDRLAQVNELEPWRVRLCPLEREPFEAELHVVIARSQDDSVEALRIGIFDLSHYQQSVERFAQRSESEPIRAREISSAPQVPYSLDGLKVLVVDDELDAREFITVVLESHGIQVTAVGSVTDALEVLKQFQPDVLISDLRMPVRDGYSLIHQLRELETQSGWHLPAAAITAYLEEDREKALTAGFEAHWHKLAQPSELIEMIAQLANQAPRSEPNSLD